MDGGGHGSNGGAHGQTRLKKPSLHLPMTAIDSFLGHSRRHFSNQLDLDVNPSYSTAGNKKEKKLLTVPSFDYDNGFGYDDHGDSIPGSCSYRNSDRVGVGEPAWLGFSNGLGFDGVGEESLKSIEYVMDTDEISGGVISRSHLSNSDKPKRKKSPAKGLVKGQWTVDEDRILVELVMQHGERNWSQIAKQLTGRVGKQCRERWNNHLRPNVKKDRWSEEEERLLVEAHENLGNKWSEIAKHIPGRTENTIKNHWNAARRRQSTRRKNKLSRRSAGVSTVLDDYIRAKNLHTPALNPKTSLSTTSTVSRDHPPASTHDTEITTDSVDELSHYVSYEEEVLFMQSFISSLSYPPLEPVDQQLPPPPPPPFGPSEQMIYSRSDDMSYAYNSYYQLGHANYGHS